MLLTGQRVGLVARAANNQGWVRDVVGWCRWQRDHWAVGDVLEHQLLLHQLLLLLLIAVGGGGDGGGNSWFGPYIVIIIAVITIQESILKS
jgi:hypothetical protein